MKKWITHLVLLVVFVGLGIYVYKYERGEPPKEKQVFRLKKEDVTKLQIKYGDTTIVCSKSDDEWRIEQPIQAHASTDEIEQLIDRIATLQAQRFLREDVKLSDADTGFDKPKAEVSLWLKGASGPETVIFGGETPISSNIYARRARDGAIFTVYSSIPDTFDKKPEDLRDKKIIALKTDDVTRVQLVYADRQIVAEKREKTNEDDEDEWNLVQPIQAKADLTSVSDILSGLEGYQVKEWAEDAPKDLAKYGLAKPQVTVTLTSKDGRQETVLIGKKKADAEEVFAQNPARKAVVTLDAKAATDLNKQAFDLQDRRLLVFERDDIDKVELSRGNTQMTCTRSGNGFDAQWKIIIPQEAEADKWKVDDILWDMADLQADKFVEEAASNLAKYGLASPKGSVRISGKGKTYEVLFGEEADDSSVYAKTADSQRVVLVDKMVFDGLPESVDDLKKEEAEEEIGTQPAPSEGLPAGGG